MEGDVILQRNLPTGTTGGLERIKAECQFTEGFVADAQGPVTSR